MGATPWRFKSSRPHSRKPRDSRGFFVSPSADPKTSVLLKLPQRDMFWNVVRPAACSGAVLKRWLGLDCVHPPLGREESLTMRRLPLARFLAHGQWCMMDLRRSRCLHACTAMGIRLAHGQVSRGVDLADRPSNGHGGENAEPEFK